MVITRLPRDEIRISMTTKCNMKCRYCHNEGQKKIPIVLSVEQIRKIAEVAQKFGVYKFRLTGGEPLLHPKICEIIKMLKTDYQVKYVSINTNGTLFTRDRINLLLKNGLDSSVVGIDYFDAVVSKNSSIGKPSSVIRDNVLLALKLGLKTHISSVYSNSNLENVIKLAKWCRNKKVVLKIIEETDYNKVNESICSTAKNFQNLIKTLQKTFQLKLDKDLLLNEVYGIHNNGIIIKFFHSKCNIRECSKCSNMHMRVTSHGNAKPCLLRRDTEFSLLSDNPILAMIKAINNLGNPPEKPIR